MEPQAEAPTTPPGLVSAIWRGPYTADMGPGRPHVKPGDSCDVTPEQAASDHWEADTTEIDAAQVYLDDLGVASEPQASIDTKPIVAIPDAPASPSDEENPNNKSADTPSAADVASTSTKGVSS